MDFLSNPLHLMLLVVVLVLLFGASKLGDVGGALGKSIREFKKEAGKDELPTVHHTVAPPASSYVPPASYASGVNGAVPPPAAPRIVEYTPGQPQPPQTQPPVGTTLPPDYTGR